MADPPADFEKETKALKKKMKSIRVFDQFLVAQGNDVIKGDPLIKQMEIFTTEFVQYAPVFANIDDLLNKYLQNEKMRKKLNEIPVLIQNIKNNDHFKQCKDILGLSDSIPMPKPAHIFGKGPAPPTGPPPGPPESANIGELLKLFGTVDVSGLNDDDLEVQKYSAILTAFLSELETPASAASS